MTILNVTELTQVPELLLFLRGLLPNVEAKGVICSSSRKEAILRELQSRKSRRFVVLLCVV